MGKRTRYGCFEFPRLLPVATPHGGIDAVRRDDAGLQDRREDVRLRGYERFRAGGRECDPDEAVRLRERYEEIGPAYHFNKTHWNGIRTAGDLPDAFIREQIRNSYLLVVRRSVTPRSLREEILRHVEEHGLPE